MAFQLTDTKPLDISLVERRRRIAVQNEYQSNNFMRTGVEGQSYVNGQTCPGLQFEGITRARISLDAAYADSIDVDRRREERRIAHDEPRRQNLTRLINRNGFNPITGAQAEVERDTYKPRACGASPGKHEFVAWESNKRMQDELRFFKLPDPEMTTTQHRARIIMNQRSCSAEELVKQRKSSLVGYGRKDVASDGAADAFSASQYGGTRWAASDRVTCESHPDEAHEIQRTFQGALPRDVWDIGTYATDPDAAKRRLAATSRAPNRIFDTTSIPVILNTKPDAQLRAMREEQELLASRTARPADRPASFTAHATFAASNRVHAVKRAEVDMVARLA